MNTTLLRNLSFCSHRVRLSPFNPTPSLLSLSSSTCSVPRFFSSRSNDTDLTQTQKGDAPSDADEVSNEELKKRIAKLQEGDAEAIPSVFEAILQRYLSGKPIEADRELMREILGKGEGSAGDDDEDDESDSDLEEISDTDGDGEDQDFDLDFEGMSGTDEEKTKR